jgi:hypothetical protein
MSSTKSVPRCYKEDNCSKRELYESLWREDSVGAVSNVVCAEAEESPMLEAVTKERVVKIQQTEKT